MGKTTTKPTPKLEIPCAHFFEVSKTEMDSYLLPLRRLICGDDGSRAEAFAGKVWESLSVNIVLTAFPVLLQNDSLGIVSAAGKASFKPLHADFIEVRHECSGEKWHCEIKGSDTCI